MYIYTKLQNTINPYKKNTFGKTMNKIIIKEID